MMYDVRCPRCNGRGHLMGETCLKCEGMGIVNRLHRNYGPEGVEGPDGVSGPEGVENANTPS